MVERPLIGNVAIVTGGSSGIGAACVRALVTAGMKVVVGARGQDHLAILEEEWGEQVAIAVRTDVRSPSDLDRLVSKATTTFGRLDALVASAGVGAYGDVLDYADDTIATMLDTNVGGTVWAVRAAVPALLASGRGGDIIIVVSTAGINGGRHEAVYAATQSAQLGLARALSQELAPMGIRVTALCSSGGRAVPDTDASGRARMPLSTTTSEADDVASAVLTVLRQPRRIRTELWTMWSMSETG
jgi:3-oxoacyl-[acyl-carrier protein] reductase